MSIPSALEFHQVNKRFSRHHAVRDLTLVIPKGSVYGVLGPNGAGKTTTIRMALNIIAPDSGSVTVLGRPSTAHGLGDLIGYLPEERGLYRRMAVREVLLFLGRLKGQPRKELGVRIDAWLERFGLRGAGADWSTARVDQLSRGMQQKVQFIGALLHDPELVVLDEPFSGLDPVNAQALKDTVHDLKTRGKTVVFSTHVIENAERMCDEVCIISQGQRLADGAVTALRARAATAVLILEFSHIPDPAISRMLHHEFGISGVLDRTRVLELPLHAREQAAAVITRLLALDAPLIRFEHTMPSLHRIFLELVGATNVEPNLRGHG